MTISLSAGSTTLDLSGLVVSMRLGDEWSYGSTDPVGGKPRKQATGKGSPTTQISLRLHPEIAGTKGCLEQLTAWADANEVLTLQSNASGDVLGVFVIESVNQRPTWAMPSGEIISKMVDVSLVDPGDVEGSETPEGVEGGSDAAGDVAPAAEDRTRPPEDVSAREIARR